MSEIYSLSYRISCPHVGVEKVIVRTGTSRLRGFGKEGLLTVSSHLPPTDWDALTHLMFSSTTDQAIHRFEILVQMNLQLRIAIVAVLESNIF